MKIAFISNLLEPTGGDDILLHHIKGLNKRGHIAHGYFTGIMDASYSKYSDDIMSDSIKIYNRNDISGLKLGTYDLIVSNGLFGASILLENNIKYVQFLQNFDPWIFGKNKDVDNIYNSFDQILLYSSHLQKIVEYYYGSKRFVKCNNGIDYDIVSQRRSSNKDKSKDKSVCFCVAYYRPYKGVKLANEIFGILKEKGFVTIEICAVNGPLDNTMEFYRNPSLDRKCEVISNAGIMLHPSVFETWNLVSMESMALGTPVVGSNSKGIMEYATNDNSIIFDNRSPELISNSIIELWEDKGKYQSIVEEGIKTAKSHNWPDIMPSIEQNYIQLAEDFNRK